jgi:CubicO group peptidase (beta-lactamase class C family)
MLLTAVMALSVVAAPATTATEARIERVLAGLLPETAFQDRYGPAATLAARMAFYHTPGVSIAVVNDGRLHWARGFGVREQGRPEPVTERTLFEAGSISKPIFALGAMRLVQEGRLALDEDVNRHLTSWKVPANGAWQPHVTLRQILSHSAGLTVHGFPGYGVDEPLPTVLQVLNGSPPANTAPVVVNILPGLQFRYSGGGITVGQLLLTDLLKEPFPALMRTLVLDPLAMADSTYAQPLPPESARMAATAHPWKGRALPGHWHLYPEMAAAGLWTTPSDLARAGIELQRALRGEKTAFLSTATAQAMLAPSAASDEVGLSVFLEGKGSALRFGHGGWDEGFVARWTFYKERGQGAVVMVNSNEGAPMIDEILRAVAREYAWPEYFPEDKPTTAAADALEAYVGSYATRTLECRVARDGDGDGLLLTPAGQPALKLRAIKENTFRATDVDAEVVFNKADGVVKSLTLTQAGKGTTAEKK